MSELYKNILLCKKGDKNAMEYLIKKFNVLINSTKFSFDKSKSFNAYDIEDNESDLVLALLEIINKMPIMDSGFNNDGCIISYIKKSIKNKKSKMTINKRRKFESLIYINELNFNEIQDTSTIIGLDSELLFYDMFKNLTKKERQVIEYKFLVGKSDSEIGEMMNISRQAINKTKNRALNKLKEFI